MSREFSEDDVRVRPARRSRPRSKERPDYSDADTGLVVAVDRGRLTVDLGTDLPTLTAVRAREMGRRSVVVGDRVGVVGDLSGQPGTLARIVRLDPRNSALRRTPDDSDPVERVVVANAEILGIVVAAAEPEPREGFVDRCLVAAYDGGLTPLLIVTKTDLASPDPLTETYGPLGVEIVGTSRTRPPSELAQRLSGRVTVLIGQSGVGKSTLVNRLVPDADRDTGRVNEVTGRGRHTSTSAVGLRLPGGGWIIDTPGIRSFGLGHVDPERVLTAFGELAVGEQNCPRGCDHEPPHCGLDDWVAAGHAGPDGPARLASVRRLLRALTP
ncbi:MAG: ribosome small subunit-dependent GTPase A [Candidatus Nanopelagicales bacterium]